MREGRKEKEKKKFSLGNPFSLPSFTHPQIPLSTTTCQALLSAQGNKTDTTSALVGFTYQHGRRALNRMLCGMMLRKCLGEK